MKKIIITFLWTCCLICNVFAQQEQVKIEAEIQGVAENSYARLYEFSSNEVVSESVFKEGKADLLAKVEKGIYRFVFRAKGSEAYLDLVFTGTEDLLSFSLNLSGSDKVPVFQNSPLNKTYYTYLQKKRLHLIKADIFSQFLAFYPTKDERIYSDIEKELMAQKKQFEDYEQNIIKQNQNYILGEYIAYKPVWYSSTTEKNNRIKNLEHIKNYWQQNLVNDQEELLNTPLYQTYVVDYIELFLKSYSVEEGIPAIKEGVDRIMTFFNTNQKVRKQVIGVLLDYFKGKDILKDILKYIDQDYVDATMVEGLQLKEYAFRLASYKALQKGNPTPNIIFNDQKTGIASMNDIKADFTIVSFWESTCPHCREQMPELNSYVKTNSNIKVVAVSLDENKGNHTKFSKTLDSMFHYCDFKGIEGPIVKEYYIQSIPTFFVLDKNKNLEGEFNDVKELKHFLDNH